MAVKIRMTRMGRKKEPFYRIVAADEDRARDGKFLETLGTYSPKAEKPSDKLKVDHEAVQAWQKKGAQVSETVGQLLKTLAK